MKNMGGILSMLNSLTVKYNPQFKQEIGIYIEECQKNKRIPTIKGFAERIGTDEQSIWVWANKKRRDKVTGELTDQLARPNFLAQVEKLGKLSQPRQENHPNLKKGNTVNVGRHSSYKEKYVDAINKYTDGKKRDKGIPTLEEIADNLGVSDFTLYKWAEEKVKNEEGNDTNEPLRPRLVDAIKRLEMVQKYKLMVDGLYNKDTNSTMAIFLLKTNHGMKETSVVETKDITPILGNGTKTR